MPGVLLPNSSRSSMKRPAESTFADASHPPKRMRQVHHAIKYKQPLASESTRGIQNENVFQSQLLRAITLALSAQGYDEAQSLALEAFRAEVEEYMLQFLNVIHHSMSTSRRKAPTPQDFIAALTAFNISPSSLLPFTNIPPAPSIVQPPLNIIPSSEPSPPNLESLLGSNLSSSLARKKRHYVPNHFPSLPSRHTWQQTPVLPTREEDALKIRERATQEGVMVEQALRRLMAASSKASERRAARARRSVITGRATESWEKALETARELDAAEKVKEETGVDLDIDDMEMDIPIVAGRPKTLSDTSFESGPAVNYDRRYWRESGKGKT